MGLSPNEVSLAAAQGWKLCDVYDLDKQKWVVEAASIDTAAVSSFDLLQIITQRARTGDSLAIKALTVIAQSNLFKKG